MNFFARQEEARQNTRILIFLYAAAVLLIIFTVYFAFSAGLYYYELEKGDTLIQTADGLVSIPRTFEWWNPDLFWAVTSVVTAVIFVGSLFKTMQLSQGGQAVAQLLGGRRVSPDSPDPKAKQLLNVVEEMAIAAGTSVPPVFLIPERSINAFAAGFSTRDAVIGVTEGTMNLLTRDELQGVIAHEFSHILNGDMRINIRMMGVLHGILLLALIGRGLLRGRGSRSKGAAALYLAAAVLIAVGYIGVFFGNLIKCAVSREREFLADASAVQYTRYPAGIAGALKKIGGLYEGSRIMSSNAEQASHFFFAEGVGLNSLFSTHPPLTERIKQIDPAFDGVYPDVRWPEPERRPDAFKPVPKNPPFESWSAAFAAAETVTAQTAQIKTAHIDYAASVLNQIPEAVRKAASEPFGARAVVFALLLDKKQDQVREEQFRYLHGYGDYNVYIKLRPLFESIRQLDVKLRLPLIDLCIPAISMISVRQYEMFRQNIEKLISADDFIDTFEFALTQVLFHHLDAHFGVKSPTVQESGTKGKWACVWILLSGLAYAGQENSSHAGSAFRKSAGMLVKNELHPEILAPDAVTSKRMASALLLLKKADFPFKKKVLDAGAAVVQHDGKILPAETELLRAFADALDCPIPPLIEPSPN